MRRQQPKGSSSELARPWSGLSVMSLRYGYRVRIAGICHCVTLKTGNGVGSFRSRGSTFDYLHVICWCANQMLLSLLIGVQINLLPPVSCFEAVAIQRRVCFLMVNRGVSQITVPFVALIYTQNRITRSQCFLLQNPKGKAKLIL